MQMESTVPEYIPPNFVLHYIFSAFFFFFQVGEGIGERLIYTSDLFSFSQICNVNILKSKVELWIWQVMYVKESPHMAFLIFAKDVNK